MLGVLLFKNQVLRKLEETRRVIESKPVLGEVRCVLVRVPRALHTITGYAIGVAVSIFDPLSCAPTLSFNNHAEL